MASEEPPLSVLNPLPQKLDGPSLLHQLVFGNVPDHIVEATPPALDYRAPDGSHITLSYSQLHHVASLLASEICQKLEFCQKLETAPASRDRQKESQQLVVPVLIPQAPELYVSLLAILKAGGAFCPIQLDAPKDRIRFILDDVQADVIMTTKEMAARLPPDRPIQAILVDELGLFPNLSTAMKSSAASTFGFAPAKTPTPEDLAYVMYTSGSTGTPKGVGVPHIAATQSLLAHNRHIPSFDRFLNFAAPTFDVSVFEIFFPLFRGATLVSCSRAELLNDLPAVLHSMNVDACELTPTVAGSLLRSRANAPGLRLLLTIGEMLTEPVIREFGAGDSPDRPSILWAMYGPTEAAIHCTLQPSMDGAASFRNIGIPLDTVSAYILEIPKDDQPPQTGDPRIVPWGQVGELVVGGYQLATGYINRPEQTAAAFIDTEKFGKLYRTGDKARITEDGLLECSGRLSGGQVKLRGQRIELGEVEQAVLRTSGCLGCAASVIDGILVAFCDIGNATARDGLEDKVLESCRSWLPRFMIPGDIVFLAEFPRLASGKVDRRLLSSQYASSHKLGGSKEEISFQDELDHQLHTISHQVLGFDVRSNDSLAAAGLDSLKSIQFAAALRSAGFGAIGAVDVLDAKSLSVLHSQLSKQQQQRSEPANLATDSTKESFLLDPKEVVPAVPLLQDRTDDIECIAECSPVQVSMLAETLSDPRAYCNWVELEFRQQNTAKVISSFEHLVEKNEALRTGFVEFNGRYVQVVWKSQVWTSIQEVDSLSRDLSMEDDSALLVPFQVQVLRNPQNGSTQALVRLHHAVYDGWSFDLIRQDLERLLAGQEIPPRLTYRDVASYYLSIPNEEENTAKQFWAQALNGFQPSPLPDLNRRHEPAPTVLFKSEELSGVDVVTVEKISRELGYAAPAIFQAAFAWLWSTLLGVPDIAIGTVSSGRTLPLDGIEAVIGPCLQTIPLRVDLSRTQSFRDLLGNVHSTNRTLLPHAFLPLAEIKKSIGLRPGQPLFDALFVFQQSLYSQRSEQDVISEVAHKDYLETKLLWEVEPGKDAFHLRATFHTDAFPEEQVDVLMEQFGHVVRHILDNVDSHLETIRTSLPQSLLSCHNLDFQPYRGTADLAKIFESTAQQSPSHKALCFASAITQDGHVDSQTVTYQELDALSNRIARLVQSSGAQIDDVIAIVMEKSILMYAGILGILKAGCTYLPLLPSTPSERVRVILEQAKVSLCLASSLAAESLLDHLPSPPTDLEATNLVDEFSDAQVDNVPVDPERVAYVIYTSGSTGTPKGVSVQHKSICSNLDILARTYPVRDDGKLLQSCSFAFDVSVFEIFFTWKCGMCLCSATNDVLFEDLEQAIRLLEITHLSMTPTVAALVDPKNTPSVEFLVTAGEAMTENVASLWCKQLYQGYGPTEVTNIITVKKMAPGDAIHHLGNGFANASSVVLSIDGNDAVPLGAIGELSFGGDQVAAGYLNQPDLTAAKFIQHPLYGRIYRSGDLGRMLPDGSLMITGRMDDQIKLRGQRIELEEINSVLNESDLVSEALTLLVHHGETPDQLASFVVSQSHSSGLSAYLIEPSSSSFSSLVSQLFSSLKSRLPSYMVPTYLIPLSSVPLTPAGKTDKHVLKKLFSSLPQDHLTATSDSAQSNEAEDDTQWTATEKQVAAIASEALDADLDSMGRWTPLTSLGLDSISAIRVSRLLHRELGKRIHISDILKNTSVARLAQIVDDQEEASASDKAASSVYSLDVFSADFLADVQKQLATHQLSFTKVLPCTPLQEGMLVSPKRGKSYVNSMLFALHVDDETMHMAWMQVCGRHEILRTCFVTTDNHLHPIAQVLLEKFTPPWLHFGEGTLGSLVEKHMATLSPAVDTFVPPVSFAVLKHSTGHFLSFVCHHAVYDGEAMSRLLWEVEQLAQAKTTATALPRPLPFGKFLEQALALPKSTDAFWSGHLHGFEPTLLLPTPTASGDNHVLSTTLDLSLSDIQQRSQKLGFSLLTVFQTVWASVLSLVTNADDVCFGNVYNGRSLALDGIDDLVAPCFNTLPIRIQLSDLRSSSDVMNYFQTLNPDLMRYQFTPLRNIQRQQLGGVGGGRLFDSLLLLQKPATARNHKVWDLLQDDGEMDFPLVCEIAPDESQDRVGIQLHHDTSFVSSKTAVFIADLVRRFTNNVLLFSASHIPSISDLSKEAQSQLQQLDLQVEHAQQTHVEVTPPPVEVATDETWNPTEAMIRTVLSQLSRVPEDAIRRDTTIYRLGLDSVRAVQVASVLRKQGLAVSAVDVMEFPSCMSLASFLSRSTDGSSVSTGGLSAKPSSSGYTSTVPSRPSSPGGFDFAHFAKTIQPSLTQARLSADDVEAVLPCTPLQAGLLAEFQRSKGQHYLNFVAFQVQDGADLQASTWLDAWKQVATMTPMLRTGFVVLDEDKDEFSTSPYAMVQLKAEAALQDHSRFLCITKDQHARFSQEKWRLDAVQHALSNLQSPPWRVAVVEPEQGGSTICLLAIHHALYDATSLAGILDNVARIAAGSKDSLVKTSSTETVVSDILHQVASSTSASSELAKSWKDLSSQAVTNKFPVLTPLKVESPAVKVASLVGSRPLKQLAEAVKKAGFTMQAVVQATWARILSSYIGDPSVVFGVVLSGRNSEATATAAFPCLTTLPVVAAAGNNPSNRALVQQMMDMSLLLHKSQHVPLTQIQKWLGTTTDSRLFDTLVVYQQVTGNSLQEEDKRPCLPWQVVDEKAVVDYPVSVEVIPDEEEEGGNLTYQITFDDSVLPAEQAATLLRQFDAIVCELAFHPDGQERDLVSDHPALHSTLPPAHRELLPSSEITLLHQFVEHQAQRVPDKTALRFVTAFDRAGAPVSRTWSYADLNTLGDQVAHLVAGYAPQPGGIVGVCFDKCPEAFFAILGILKAGCSFVALDPGAPASRKEFILQDSQAALLLTDVERAKAEMGGGNVPTIAVEEAKLHSFCPRFARDNSPRFARSTLPSDISPRSTRPRSTLPSDNCYCLYTSGTTGTPKGCAITHENAVQAMLAFQELFRDHWDEDSRWLQFASFHFDVSVLEQYWTWSMGLELVCAPRDLILEDLAGTISRLNITHIDLTPSLGRLLDPRDVPSLCRGVFITGGEPLKQEMLDPWGPTGAVHNFYGPTEATIGVTSYPQVPRNGRASNIGRQFPNVGSYVFHPGTQIPVLRGAVGELCVSGKLVGKGYLNRDDLTNEKFPTLLEDGERIYRTGDLVRLLHDGCFDFLGRADDQVKLRGQRLEIGEINHAILVGVEAGVDDVATLVIRDAVNSKDFLVSFVVLGSESARGSSTRPTALQAISTHDSVVLSRQVQAACRERLPGYMVPTYVVQLPFMPLSPNNKAEAKELKKLFHSLSAEERMKSTGASGSAENEEVQSAAGKSLTKVLRKLKFLDPDETLSAQTSIFELGVDSISVLRVARALKRAGVPATPSLLLAHPTVGDLVARLDAHKADQALGSILESKLLVDACQHRYRGLVCQQLAQQWAAITRPDDIEYIAPCSALQQGMISRSRSGDEHKATYFNTFLFDLEPTTSVDRLQQAWTKVIQNNAILRTRFVATGDGFVQVALKSSSLWREVDTLDESERQWVNANQGDVIGSPLELLFVPRQNTLVLHIFHGLYDAISLDLVLDHVQKYYSGGDVDIENTPTFLQALIHGPLKSYSSCRSFWEEHLGSSLFRPLPRLGETVDDPSSISNDDISSKRTIPFPSIDTLRSTLGVTHAAIVQALWVSVLQRIHHGGDVTLGLVLAGRTMEDLDRAEDVVGPLFNTLPFHMPQTQTSGMSWASLVQACHRFNTTILPFQQVALRDIQKWCSGGKPLFDVLFSFQLGGSSQTRKLWTTEEPESHADYPLALEAELSGTGASSQLHLLLVAKNEWADKAGLETVLDDLQAAVEAISTDSQGVIFPDLGAEAEAGGEEGAEAGAKVGAERDAETNEEVQTDWTGDAAILRREMARLGSVAEEDVRRQTTLLELGLDSVDTIKLSARLRASGIQLKNSQLIQGQSIAEFLKMVSQVSHVQQATQQPPSTIHALSTALHNHLVEQGRDLSNVEAVLPPTPLQEAMVADMVASDFTRYFNHDILKLSSDVDLTRFQQAWLRVVRRYPILRTGFVRIDSPALDVVYCQVVRRHVDLSEIVSFHEVNNEQEVFHSEQLSTVTDEAIARARQGQGETGLFHLSLARVSGQSRWYVVLSIAHALYDGWSLDLLHQKVWEVYGGRGIEAMEEVTQGSAYIQQLDTILQSSGPEADAFWSSFLSGAQPTFVQPHEEKTKTKTKTKTTRIEVASSTSVARLVEFCKTKAVSVQVVGQACWAAVLATLTGSLDVLFGVVLSGRDADADAEEDDAAMFPTMNTVPVRVVLHGTVSDLLQYMQSNMGSITAYQHYPLRKAQRAVDRQPSSLHGGSSGIFNTLFIQQKRLTKESLEPLEPLKESLKEPLKEPLEPLATSVQGISDVEYPICVELEMVDDDILWRTACDDVYVSTDGAAQLLHQLDAVLSFLVGSDEQQDDGLLRFEDGGVSVCGLASFGLGLEEEGGEGEVEEEEGKSEIKEKKEKTWSPTEDAIRSVLATVAGLPPATIRRTGQTVYHLGIDSISAIKVSSLLKANKGLLLGVRAMLSAQSVEEMAAAAVPLTEAVPLEPLDVKKDLDSELQALLASVEADQLVAASEARETREVREEEKTSEARKESEAREEEKTSEARKKEARSEEASEARTEEKTSEARKEEARTEEASEARKKEARIEKILPATAMQVHMVSVWQNTNGKVFFPEFHYRLHNVHGGRQAIAAAWRQLVTEFPILRTVLLATKSASIPLLQVVLSSSDSTTNYDDDDHDHDHDHDYTWPAVHGKALAFLSVSPVPEKDHSFNVSLKIHHALYDAVSLRAILDRFRELCSAPTILQQGNLQERLAVWTHITTLQTLASSKAQHKTFWTQYFQGAKVGTVGRSVVTSKTRIGHFHPAVLDMDGIRTTATQHGLGLQSLLFAAYAKTKTAVVGEPEADDKDVVFGVYLANRQASRQPEHQRAYPTLCLVPLLVRSPAKRSLIDIAAQIQRDIHAISSSASSASTGSSPPATAGLWEIREWTGIEVDSFVNFLLPEEGGGELDVSLDVSLDVTMEEVSGQPVQDARPQDYADLLQNTVQDAYMDAVDVELAVRSNHLDIGVFGPQVRVGEEGPEGLIGRIVRELAGCC